MEQDAAYRTALVGNVYNSNNVPKTVQINTYRCPSDPSYEAGASSVNRQLMASYAANALAFSEVRYDTPGNYLTAYVHSPQMLPANFNTKLFPISTGGKMIPAAYPDGTSNSIFWVEKFAVCSPDGNPDNGGTQWHVAFEPHIAPYVGYGGATSAGVAYGSNTPGQQSPTFGTDGFFQVQPAPWVGTGPKACKPGIASTGHAGAIMACLGDGSVRTCSASVSPKTWWMAMVPDDGNALPSDW
jgi:hypothetical protein